MTDVLTRTQRQYCMSQIKGKHTQPEMLLRKALWAANVRYRINYKIHGRPDIAIPGKKIAIFVDGCFWHRCPEHYVAPKTRAEFWETKINSNVKRDKINNENLKASGWIVIRYWEHQIVGDLQRCVQEILKTIEIISDQDD